MHFYLIKVFLATPGVVHTVISPTSFRAEYRRAGSGSSLLARPVKLQVDMVRATGGISTGSGHQNNINSISSEREVYAVNFQLLSGKKNIRKFRIFILYFSVKCFFSSNPSGNITDFNNFI